MSEEISNSSSPENQFQRWMKYGGNVLLSTVIVVLLGVAAIYLAEKKPYRRDTTAAGLYSLKPQTLNLIKDNKNKYTIISLYTKAKPSQSTDQSADDASAAPEVDQAGVVADLLEEYRTRGSNIETETIDPVLNPTKVDDLINQVEAKYGGEIDKYKSFSASIPAKYDSISGLANGELDQIKGLPLDQIKSDDVEQSVGLALFSVRDIPKIMKQGQDAYAKFSKQKIPDYKAITDSVSETMSGLSDIIAKVIDGFNHSKDDAAVPTEIRKYMTDSLPKYVQIKKEADDLVTQVKGLGELKLDTLKDALKQKNPILVRGDKQWRVIPYEKVWKTDSRNGAGGEGSARPTFAGEQMITTAILSLDQPNKPKVCFVRAGGPPMTDFGGNLNSIADRLRDYNFDVSEKDLSGTYAMQAMQQQQQAPTEPADADIEDAVWVVDGSPAQQNPMMGGPPPSIAAKVADHMEKGFHYANGQKVPGGSGFVMFMPQGDNLSAALKPWGIVARTDAIAVHPLIKSEGGSDGDIINAAQHIPYIFTVTDWGDHMITKPIQSLMGLLLGAVPIEVSHTDGVTATALIPVPGAPASPESWGETDLRSVDTGPKFDKDADIAGPLFAAAVAEKGGSRMVCLGSEATLSGSPANPRGNIVDLIDKQMYEKRQIVVPQFPGSAEFFMNSIFWLSHQEPMIAISPAAMNISRVGEISKPMLGFWHVGVLLIGLPGLVLLAGAGVYFSRRD